MSNLALFIHINSGCLRSWTSQYDSNALYKWTETASASLMCVCTSPCDNHAAFWVTKWDAGLTRCGASACGWNWILEWCWCCCCSVSWERQRRGNRTKRREGGRSTVRKSDRKSILFHPDNLKDSQNLQGPQSSECPLLYTADVVFIQLTGDNKNTGEFILISEEGSLIRNRRSLVPLLYTVLSFSTDACVWDRKSVV